MTTSQLKQNILAKERIGYAMALECLAHIPQEELFALAHELRQHYQGMRVETCAIQNARSGRCSEDCKWCAQSRFYQVPLETYPLINTQSALIEARHNATKGVARFSLVTSGRTLSDLETLAVCNTYQTLQKEVKMRLCASLGLLNREQLAQLWESGVERYHCNLESAPSYFGKLCTTHTLEQKIQTLKWAKEVGMTLCSGGIIGMGESEEQRVELAITLQELGVDSIPINILSPIVGTPLEKTPPLSEDEVLRTLAIMRITNPKAEIRLAGGRSMIKHFEQKAFNCGVSAVIVGDLLTTTGSDIDTDRARFREYGFKVD